ncbi:MAG: hypothetical protein WC773_02000 [Patescibacteria group bacterium]|jgi:hypothetical protein
MDKTLEENTNDQNQNKKPIWRYLRWVLLAFAILVVGVLIFLYCYYYIWMKMSTTMVTNAENALANGISINDERDDFVIMSSNKEELNAEDNPSPYRLDYFDIKSVSVGADDQYLYIKTTFFGTIPKTSQKVNGDNIVAIAAKAEITDDQGKEYLGMAADFGYVAIIGIPALNTYYSYGATGIEWPENARYTHQDRDSKVYGGGGTDYIMGAYPLNKMGLEMGQTINIRFPMEVRSHKFTHAAVDVLAGSGKSPGIVTWKLGSNQYTINNNTDNSAQSNDKK